jgi:uncharacterized protein
MIIDIHAHLWASNYDRDKADIVIACEKFGFSRVYISTLESYYPCMEDITAYNRLTKEFMNEHPGLVRGFVYADPRHPNCIDVIRQGVLEYGMEGVKIWVSLFCDDPRVNKAAEQCIDFKIPMLVHAFHKATGQLEHESTGPNVRNLALRYPELKLIMAHLGGNAYHTLRCIEDLPNVYSDLSGTLCYNDDLSYAVECIGADRILFGTDMPASPHHTIGQVNGTPLTDEERDKIYYKNSLKLLEGSI